MPHTACTHIPLRKKTDMKYLRQVCLDEETVRKVLASITVCSNRQDVSRSYDRPHEVDVADFPNDSPETWDELLVKQFRNHAQHKHFVIEDGRFFVTAIKALMLWCLQDETLDLCVTVIDKDFIKPPEWSYRYYWRLQLQELTDMSVNQVDLAARQLAHSVGIED